MVRYLRHFVVELPSSIELGSFFRTFCCRTLDASFLEFLKVREVTYRGIQPGFLILFTSVLDSHAKDIWLHGNLVE